MIHVRLDQFEGPLALLLHLIRKEEMDIYNIQIHRITSQYLEYIKRMRELDLELAGEFIAMAATLIHIKSRLLLPQYDENGVPIEAVEDPRKELVQKLLEYQMYQEASKSLNERPLLGRDVWARGQKEDLPTDDGEIVVDEGGLFALISMYRKVARQVEKNIHTVKAKGQSIKDRIMEIKDRLLPGSRVVLKDLIQPIEWTSQKVLITFLSLLELTKMGFTSLFQAETYGDIHIDTLRSIERDVIDRVEEYDRKPEEVQDVARALEADAGGRDLHDYIENAEDQLGLVAEPSIVAEMASDDEILAAEAEMGMSEEQVDLSRVDDVLANFSLELPIVHKEVSQEVTEFLVASDEPALEQQTGISDITEDDFEKAWATLETSPEEKVADLAEQARASMSLFDEPKATEAVEEADDFEIVETVKRDPETSAT